MRARTCWILAVCVLLVNQPFIWADTYTNKLQLLQQQLKDNPNDISILFKLGDLCHDTGITGNEDAVDLAEKYFNQILVLQPSNALATAFLGSTFTMKARDAVWPFKRLSHINKGFALLDAGVALAPEDVKVRFCRANNNYYVPEYMGRKSIVLNDFTWLYGKLKTEEGSFDLFMKQTVCMRFGQLFLKTLKAESLEAWTKGIQYDANSEEGKQMTDLLSKEKAGH